MKADNQLPSTSTNIDDLPSEVVIPIINSLPYKDKITAAGVSTRWHSIIDHRLGRKIFIGRACQFTPDDEERYKHHYVPIDVLTKVGVDTLYVGEIKDPVNSMGHVTYFWTKLKEAVFGQHIPKYKFPHLVKNIFFDGPLPPKYFDALVRPAKNLERLDIHLSSLCCLAPSNLDLPLMNNLQTLNIWGHKLTQGLFTTFYSSMLVMSNVVALLENNNFPYLKNLALEYPFDIGINETKVTETLLEFLKKHQGHLEKLKVCVNLFITEEPNAFETPQDRTWVQKAKATSKTLKLKHIEVTITSIYKVRLTRIWFGFIETQNTLESVMLMTFRLQSDILYRICEQNFKTLKQIGLTRLILNENGRFNPINCSVFQNCTSLTDLFLEGLPTGMPNSPGLIEVNLLPLSLQRVEIGCIIVSSIDSQHILCNLPNLREVFLNDTGRSGGNGVTIDTLTEIIQTRRIKKVSLYACILGVVPAGGILNGDPDNPSRLISSPYGMMELVLDESGYYKSMARPHLFEILFD